MADGGGARTVLVSRERLSGWIARFSRQHGDPGLSATEDELVLTSPDGAVATIHVPFPPWVGDADDLVAGLLRHLHTDRTVGVLLVRRRGHAVGVFEGRDLVASKVGRSYVQGTTKAGGWSQQRFARRRANQARSAYEDAADDAYEVLLPRRSDLAAVVTGGDRTGLKAVLGDPRLSPLTSLVSNEVLAVPDPRLRVLTELSERLLCVRIDLNDLA